MNEVLMLVDLENIHRFDLSRVSPNARVKVFAGESQRKLPADFVEQALAMAPRCELVRINGNGSNALDFHIAYYLGKGVCEFPNAQFVIVSNDKGFDPLVRHLVKNGVKCRRDEQARPAPASKTPLPAHAQAVADLLKRSEKNKRPRKRATLTNYLATHFNKKMTREEIKQAVEHLLKAGLIAGTEAAVTYNL
jgi:hypothetical protein